MHYLELVDDGDDDKHVLRGWRWTTGMMTVNFRILRWDRVIRLQISWNRIANYYWERILKKKDITGMENYT